jgi:hypothetical protein
MKSMIYQIQTDETFQRLWKIANRYFKTIDRLFRELSFLNLTETINKENQKGKEESPYLQE